MGIIIGRSLTPLNSSRTLRAVRAITVNNVQPGPTHTDIVSSAQFEMVKPFIPLKRIGDVSEVASFVSYLASEEAGFITGASLTIDGGFVA
ncbi:MAG TPA: SDR family oxidoreductase [Candidatus Binatia bacterium]|nr:SDR family oxidoreductase [Candidatus Binatia bacterium]